MSSAQSPWYLLKHDDASVFGPMPFSQLAQWARTAQISPLDKVSVDLMTWLRAPMLPELEMDWLIEVSTEHCYGPTTFGAIQDFLDRGEIDFETVLINARDGTRQRVGDQPTFTQIPDEADESSDEMPEAFAALENSPREVAVESSIKARATTEVEAVPLREPSRIQRLHGRIRELEKNLLEERQLLTELNNRYNRLEEKYIRLLGHQSATMRFDD